MSNDPTQRGNSALAQYLHSFRVVGAMARATFASLHDASHPELAERRARIDANARRFAQAVVAELQLDLHVVGREHIAADQTYVLVSNHQSLLDIPVLYAALPPLTVRMVGKRELFSIPVWGRALKAAEFIAIDRSNRDAAIASLSRAATLMAQGVSVWMAPEGSRSADGSIGPLKKGAFHLAQETQRPLVPIALRGTRDALPKGALRMRSGVSVQVTIGAPLPAPTAETFARTMEAVRAFFVRHTAGQ